VSLSFVHCLYNLDTKWFVNIIHWRMSNIIMLLGGNYHKKSLYRKCLRVGTDNIWHHFNWQMMSGYCDLGKQCWHYI